MSDYIEIRNIDFKQIKIDNVPYSIEKMETIDGKAHLIYAPMNKNITSITVLKHQQNKIYKFMESD